MNLYPIPFIVTRFSDSFFNSRNLDVYITKIRGYLKEDESLNLVTIKGIGYRFIVE